MRAIFICRFLFYSIGSTRSRKPLWRPSGEGKNYVLRKVAENFPKEDVIFFAGMTDKALFHRQGTLVVKNDAGEYEPIDDRLEQIDSEIEDKEYEMKNNTTKNDQFQKLVSRAQALQPSTAKYLQAKDLYVKSLQSEIASYRHFRNFLATGNKTEDDTSTQLLSNALKFEIESFAAFNNRTLTE
jgi:hypothetical protein